MPAPIALQLYTLRDAMAQDFAGVVRKVAEIGYVGVEPAGFPGTTAQAAARLFRSLGLQVTSAHLPLPLGDKRQEALDAAGALGLKRIVSGLRPKDFETMDMIQASCERFNQAAAVAAEHGLTLGIHNHWWEYQKVDGRYVYQVLKERVDPQVFFQVDAYWVQTAGCDPAAVLAELGTRAPLVHVKDGPCVRDQPMQALGEGKIDFEKLVAAGTKYTQWWIVELDQCATDMMEAVVKSYRFMVGNGHARGNR
jgi:sugar phosphate isomerase/epimerase